MLMIKLVFVVMMPLINGCGGGHRGGGDQNGGDDDNRRWERVDNDSLRRRRRRRRADRGRRQQNMRQSDQEDQENRIPFRDLHDRLVRGVAERSGVITSTQPQPSPSSSSSGIQSSPPLPPYSHDSQIIATSPVMPPPESSSLRRPPRRLFPDEVVPSVSHSPAPLGSLPSPSILDRNYPCVRPGCCGAENRAVEALIQQAVPHDDRQDCPCPLCHGRRLENSIRATMEGVRTSDVWFAGTGQNNVTDLTNTLQNIEGLMRWSMAMIPREQAVTTPSMMREITNLLVHYLLRYIQREQAATDLNRGAPPPDDGFSPCEEISAGERPCCCCLVNRPQLYLFCGHVICRRCRHLITTCPVCRSSITDSLPLFL